MDVYKSLVAVASHTKKENLAKEVVEKLENASSYLMVHFGVPERIALLQSIAATELSEMLGDEQQAYVSSLEASTGESEKEAVDQNIE